MRLLYPHAGEDDYFSQATVECHMSENASLL